MRFFLILFLVLATTTQVYAVTHSVDMTVNIAVAPAGNAVNGYVVGNLAASRLQLVFNMPGAITITEPYSLDTIGIDIDINIPVAFVMLQKINMTTAISDPPNGDAVDGFLVYSLVTTGLDVVINMPPTIIISLEMELGPYGMDIVVNIASADLSHIVDLTAVVETAPEGDAVDGWIIDGLSSTGMDITINIPTSVDLYSYAFEAVPIDIVVTIPTLGTKQKLGGFMKLKDIDLGGASGLEWKCNRNALHGSE